MRAAVLAPFLMLLTIVPSAAQAPRCPAPLEGAERLVLVTADTMASRTATVRRFARAGASAPWREEGAAFSAQIGRNGLGWAHAFRADAAAGEPIKVDGDKRAPAGVFRLGRPFGFGPSRLKRYLRIAEGMTCVDDPGHPAYNTIASRAGLGGAVRGEKMWRIPEYRRGLIVDYPTDRKARAGSCIFIHVRVPGASGTSGCVSLPEPQVAALQDFAEPGAAIAILPRTALDRFNGCLP